MDVWVNFKNATKWQAEGIFKCFFPSKPSQTSIPSSSQSAPGKSTGVSQDNLAIPKRKRASLVVHTLSEEEISVLAKRFGESIPEDEFSVSLLSDFCLSISDGDARGPHNLQLKAVFLVLLDQ